jgi:hypothetical protein
VFQGNSPSFEAFGDLLCELLVQHGSGLLSGEGRAVARQVPLDNFFILGPRYRREVLGLTD